MLPQRCKKCKCYVAPHLPKCPRCGAASAVVTKPTKEDKALARATQDAKVPTIQGKHIHWIPSERSLRIHRDKLTELDQLFKRAPTPKLRNAIRSEIRATKAHLSRSAVPSGKKGWTTENMMARHAFVVVFISPKKHRYVLAERDRPADLLIVPANKKHRKGMPVIRLQRFEKSPHKKLMDKQKKEDKEHSVRRKVKKAHRAKKRKLKGAAS